MKVYIGADHRGFSLKEKIYEVLKLKGVEVEDMGAATYDPDDDEVDFAKAVCEKMEEGDRGILLCGSGHGMDIAANRFHQIRCVVGFNLDVTVQAREHEDANVLAIPAEWLTEEEAIEIAQTFLRTVFSGKERYIKRLTKLSQLP